MSEFEKYLQDHKDRLEPPEVNPKIWLAIENETLKSKHRRRSIYLKLVSAAAVLLLGVLIFNSDFFGGNTSVGNELLAKHDLEQSQFTQEVNFKKDALSKAMIPSSREEDFQVLLQQLEFLDKEYESYLKNIVQNGHQSLQGDKILEYYRSKIELLDKIQQEIEKVNYYENKFPSNEEKVGLQI